MQLTDSKCIVIKIGSALLVNEQQLCVNYEWLESLINDIAKLINQGIKVVLVSSGAVAFGKLSLDIAHKQLTLDNKMAVAAVGQIQLMHTYQTLLSQQRLKAAQVLLTLDDTEHRRRYINLRNTLHRLIHMGIIPIINENDSVSSPEIRYGDNDRLSARVAQMVDADTLVLLSDIDGLYTDDPRLSTQAMFIPQVDNLTSDIFQMAKDSSTNYGSGGMRTKLDAAEIATNSGCRMLITAGKPLHPIENFIKTQRGTWFVPKITLNNAKKIWLKQHLKALGTITIDSGAVSALQKGASLLPIGIVDVSGQFEKGSAVNIVTTENNKKIARGLSNYSKHDVLKIMQKNTSEIEVLLGYSGCKEVVHRDNMVIL